MGNDNKPTIDKKAIAAFCQRHKIGRFSLFGSILGDDFGPESDIDVLVDLRVRRTEILSTAKLIHEESRLESQSPGAGEDA